MRRLGGLAAAVVGLAALLPACGKPHDEDLTALRAALARTGSRARTFVSTETGPDGRVVVKGAVADDFRYKVLFAVNGRPVLQEVVADDGLADQVLDPSAFTLFARSRQPQAAGSASAPSSSDSGPALDALRAGRWVLDDAGAPTLTVATGDRAHRVGQDFVFDALTVLDYARLAAGASARVHKLNTQSIDYRPREDPFPKPTRASGVIRYDLDRQPMPRAGGQGSFNQQVPSVATFRKMAVYVKDGMVVEIREDIDVASRLKDIARTYDIDLPSDRPVAARVKTAIDAINAVRIGQGDEPIRVRRLVYRLTDVGRSQTIELPTDAVSASLLLFENRGAPAA